MCTGASIGCACEPRTLGQLGATPSVYLFYLDTRGGSSSPGGPYSYMPVPLAYFGQVAVSMPNAPPDATVLNASQGPAGTIQVRWYGTQVTPGTLASSSNSDSSGNVGISANYAGTANNIINSAPPSAVLPQAETIAASIGAPVLVGVVAQSTTPWAFQQAHSTPSSTSVAPVVSSNSAALSVSAPVQARSTQQVQATPTLVVGTQNPQGSSGGAGTSGLSTAEIALMIGAVALLILLSKNPQRS